jgi:hypothetical protein
MKKLENKLIRIAAISLFTLALLAGSLLLLSLEAIINYVLG